MSNVFHFLRGGHHSIRGEKDGRFVILEKDIVFNFVALSFLKTLPLPLPKEDDSKWLSTADKNVLKKTTNNISFAPDVKFTQQTILRPNVPRINKEQNTRQESMRQQVTNTVVSPLMHCRSVLGDQLSRSPQYRRVLRDGETRTDNQDLMWQEVLQRPGNTK